MKAKAVSKTKAILALAGLAVAGLSARAATITVNSYEFLGSEREVDWCGSCTLTSSSKPITVTLHQPTGWKVDTVYYAKGTTEAGIPNNFYSSLFLEMAIAEGNVITASGWSVSTSGSSKTLSCPYSSSFYGSSAAKGIAIRYEPWLYTVSFDANGGSGTMDAMTGLSYTNTTTTLTANAFTRTGYTFAGWTTNETGIGTVFDNQSAIGGEKFGVTKDGDTVNLYATWTPITYTVTCSPAGGSGGSVPTSATYDTAFAVTAPTRTGYAFAGWTLSGHNASTAYWGTSASCSSSVPSDGKVSADGTVYFKNLTATAGATVTLTAQWKAIETAVTFSKEGGSGGTSNRTIAYGTSKDGFSTIEPPTKTGANFQGYWTTQASGGDQYFDVNGYLLRDWDVAQTEVTLYARWSSVTYTVAFDPNGGSGTIADKTVAYSDQFPLPDGTGLTPTDVRYSFAGWSRTANGSVAFAAGDETSVADNSTWLTSGKLTFYAVWQDNRKTISVTVGEYGTASPTTLQVVPGQPYGTLPTVTAKSYKKAFAGWFADETGDAPITEETIVPTPAPSAIYARWSNATYVVRFNGNGATSGTTASQTVEFSVATALTANAFARTGYAFAGWARTADTTKAAYADGATVTDLATSANATVDLYAVWTANSYLVAFDANGGGGTMPTLTNRYDVAFTLPACAFTAPAFSAFGGWTDAATGATYADGATVSNLTATADATVTLKAVWNSTLSDLSKAMHCNTLVWSNLNGKSAYAWQPSETGGYGADTESCARQANGRKAFRSPMLARLTGTQTMGTSPNVNGTMSFMWKPSSADARLCWGMSKSTTYPTSGDLTEISASGTDWTNVVVKVAYYAEKMECYFFLDDITDEDEDDDVTYECIDRMTWTPDGTHPTPTAEDAVEASSLTVSGDTLSLSFTGDSRFAYHLQATDSLAPADWYDFGATNVGADAAQSFAIPLDAACPQRFFRIETIPK